MGAKRAAFAVIPSLILGLLAVLAWRTLEPWKSAEDRGLDATQAAWEASFMERGLAIPSGGPREGYWESRVRGSFRPGIVTARVLPNVQLRGLVETDELGIQRYAPATMPVARILILGGSVAWGYGASSIKGTYFNTLGVELERSGKPAEIEVLATPAWRSQDELAALINCTTGKCDLVVCLNGMNDLTVVLAESFTQDGATPGTGKYHHEGNYGARAEGYIKNISEIANVCRSRGSKFLVVLQPSPIEKRVISRYENVSILQAWGVPDRAGLSPAACIQQMYAAIRETLADPVNADKLAFYDASRLFDDVAATTFTDLWHLSDPGHEILGKAMAREIEKLLSD